MCNGRKSHQSGAKGKGVLVIVNLIKWEITINRPKRGPNPTTMDKQMIQNFKNPGAVDKVGRACT